MEFFSAHRERHDSIDFIHVLECACTCRGQKTLGPVKLSLQIVVIVVSCQVYAGSETQVLCQSSKPSLQPFSCILDSRFETVYSGLGVCGCFVLFCFDLGLESRISHMAGKLSVTDCIS